MADIAANTQEDLAEDAEDSSEPTMPERTDSESLLPRSLSTQKKHLEIRKKADAAYLKAIERMEQKYSKHNGHHIKQFAVGDNVSVRIPRIDRANTDLQRLPCIVVEIVGKACTTMYRLCCKVGVLNTCYGAGDLELFTGSFEFEVEGWRSMPVLSVREAAKLQAPWNSFTKNRCTCKSRCNTKRCSCVRNNIECSNHCHRGSICDNKEGKIGTDQKSKGADDEEVCGINLQSDIDDSSACSIICDDSDIGPQNDIVPVSAGTHIAMVSSFVQVMHDSISFPLHADKVWSLVFCRHEKNH